MNPNRIPTTLAALSSLVALAAPIAGMAQEATPKATNDPVVCAFTEDGSPIRIGSQVFDSNGREIGSVSLSQCTPELTSPGKIRVFLRLDNDYGVGAFSLHGAKLEDGQLKIQTTVNEILASKSAWKFDTPSPGGSV